MAKVVPFLVLGVAATVVIFSVSDAVFRRSLPGEDPGRVVQLTLETISQATIEFSYPEIVEMRERQRSFQSFASVSSGDQSFILSSLDAPVEIRARMVSSGFFDVLRVRPALGRAFEPADDIIGARRAVVLSHRVWAEVLGGRPSIVGESLRLNNIPYEVLGIMPTGFSFPNDSQAWVTIASAAPRLAADKNTGTLFGLGRLRPEVTNQAATADMAAIVSGLAIAARTGAVRVALESLPDVQLGRIRPALVTMQAAALILLLVACANVAVLLIARAIHATDELALRIGIGATPMRLAWEALASAFVQSALVVVLGSFVAWFVLSLLASPAALLLGLSDLSISINRPAVVLGIALVACATGVVPVVAALRAGAVLALARPAPHVPGSLRLRGPIAVLIAMQVALAATAGFAGGVVTRSLVQLRNINLGFQPEGALTFRVLLPRWKHPEPWQRQAFFSGLVEQLEQEADIRAAGAVTSRPLRGPAGWDYSFFLEGESTDAPPKHPLANYQAVTPGYFAAAGIRLLRGRIFTARDTDTSPPVVIVGAAFARTIWPDQDPVGKRLLADGARVDERGNPVYQEVVGVVEDVRYRSVEDVRLDLYAPHLQSGTLPNDIVVRVVGNPTAAIEQVRAVTRRFDRDAVLVDLEPMTELVSKAYAVRTSLTVLLWVFGIAVGLLTTLGLHAAVYHLVETQRRGIAIHLAIGAQRTELRRRLLLGAGLPVVGGLVAGGMASVVVGRLMAGELVNVAMIGVETVFVSLLACLVVSVAVVFLSSAAVLRANPADLLRSN